MPGSHGGFHGVDKLCWTCMRDALANPVDRTRSLVVTLPLLEYRFW